MSNALNDELTNNFRALKREAAQAAQNGVGKIKTGKDPLDFTLYCLLGLELMKLGGNDAIFAHTLMIFCWNLLCL